MLKIDREVIKSHMPILTDSIHWAKRRINELPALPRHLNRKKIQKANDKILVVFICQYIPAWSKNKQLYETLKKDSRFRVMLLCIPNRVRANKLIDPDDLSNDVYEYFTDHGYPEAVNALIGRDTWLDLEAYHPDYVFYNRYDRPMPVQYTSSEVSKYAKVCLIIYGVALLKSEESMFDKVFASNTYCFFAESQGIQKEFERWNHLLCRLKLSKSVFCGIPAVENAYKAKHDECRAWDFSKNEFRIIYTPRWTTNPAWGGSSFMKYKDFFLKTADEHHEIDILLRPHPLMFDNYIKTGLMTSEEVDNYKNECNSRSNIRVDSEKEYQSTFWKSSVLVTDYSSMIIEYFITRKPVIYLTYDSNIEYTDQMKAMLSGCYIVKDDEELGNIVERLLEGNDPLAEKRAMICEKELSEEMNFDTSDRIKQVLLDDCKR